MLRVDGVSNSSVLQIGSAGAIKALSNLYNTGGFTEEAPAVQAASTDTFEYQGPVVPLTPPAPTV